MDDVNGIGTRVRGILQRVTLPVILMLAGAPCGALTYDAIASTPAIQLPPAEWLASLPHTVMAAILPSGAPPLPSLPGSRSAGVQSNSLLSLPAAVGRTAGTFSVSANGAAVYTIPLWTPPGTRGVEPHLALVYSSGGANDIMGPGWSLAGLSAISRCNQTYAQDGAAAPVTLTSADVFCLDSNRLRLTGGTYGAAASTYQTEIETFSQVTANGTAGNGPNNFVVAGKDGLYYEYGNTTDSRAVIPGNTTPYAWLLNKVRDRQGNNLTITYTTTPGAYEPSSIQYTQSPSLSTTYPYTVSFTYQNRVTNLSKYIAGGQIQQTQVLSQINVQSSSTSVKTYNFGYSTTPTTLRDSLTTIQECSPSDCLPSTQIGYQGGAAGVSSPTTSTGSGATNGRIQTVDFDGDGRLDLLYATTSGSNNVWWVQLATATGYSAPISTGVVTPATTKILVDDFEGKGQNEILAPNGGYWYVYRLVSGAFTATSTAVPVNTAIYSIATADVQGDGLPDLVWSDGTNIYLQTNTSAGGTVSFGAPVAAFAAPGGQYATLYGNNDFPASAINHMDFDGDGRDDLVLTYYFPFTSSYVVGPLLSRGTTFAAPSNGWGLYNGVPPMLPVRWNDDACTDLEVAGTIQISACNGASASVVGTATTAPVMALDWDGDGRTDLLYNSGGTWQLIRSLGTAAATPVSTGIVASSGIYVVTDVNGDGLSDLVLADPTAGNALKYGLHAGAAQPADLATSFVDGFGMAANPSYVPITQNNYTKGTGVNFPDQDFVGPLYVVPSFSASDGTGGTYTQSFWYYYAAVNRQGRGFDGFEARYATDSRTGLYTYDYYHRGFPYTGTLIQSDTHQVGPGTTTTIQTPTWTALTFGSGFNTRYFPYASANSETDYEVGGTLNGQPIRTIATSTTVDSYGNPTVQAVSTTDVSTSSPFQGEVYTTTTTNTITNDTTNWCLGRPTQTTVQSTTPTGTLTRTTSATVNYPNCRNTQEQIEPGSSTLNVTTNYGFDGCGNVNSVTVIGKNPDGSTMSTRTTSTNYSYFSSTRCQFPESVTNAAGETSTIAYNYNWGLPSTKTDPNGISVSWLYDGYGRKSQENHPDGTNTTWSYVACNAANSYCSVPDLRWIVLEYVNATNSLVITDRIRYFDGFNRSRYDEQLNLSGGLTYTIAVYDALGRKLTQYLPGFAGTGAYHTFTYDLANRPTADRLYHSTGTWGGQTLLGYAGAATTTTDPNGNATIRYTDARGKLRRVVDPSPGGTTSYTYEPFGNLASTTDAIGAGSTTTYNLRGFKTASYDPDAGSWTYSPNSLGETVSQTDAKSQTTTYAFDAVSRMLSRSEAEGLSTWTYGTSAASHNIGKLSAISGPGYSEARAYDAIGRPATTIYTADTTYQIDYAYNATTGLLDNVTYPASTSGYRLRAQYGYQWGILNQVSDYNAPSTVWWHLNAQNPFGAATDETLGNGVHVLSTNDDATNALLTRTSGTASGSYSNQQNLAYTWDFAGNLLQRADNLQTGGGCGGTALCESFIYDALNRLTNSYLGGSANLTVGFDTSGNIASKTGIGSYTYDPVKRHAVRSTGNGWTFTYDANGNMQTGRGQTITWTSYNKPSSITNGSIGSSFYYTPDRQYYKQSATYSNGPETTIYIGGLLEKVTGASVTDYRHLIHVGDVTVIVDRSTGSNSNTYYATQDSLGSNSVITNSTGAVVLNESFDAYGARRGSGWTGTPTSGDYTQIGVTTRRGFTGHTMLDNVNLVHMNGRVYDPQLGRMLSVDPVIPTLALSQALNPYSYVMNNPLALIDPSGYSWLSSLFHSIGNFLKKWGGTILSIGLMMMGVPPLIGSFVGSGFSSIVNGGNFGSFLSSWAIGAVAGMIGGAIGGPLAGPGATLGERIAAGVIAGGIGGGIAASLTGGSFWDGFAAGAITGGIVAGVMGPNVTSGILLAGEPTEEVLVQASRIPSFWQQAWAYAKSSIAGAAGGVAGIGNRIYRAYWDNPNALLTPQDMRLANEWGTLFGGAKFTEGESDSTGQLSERDIQFSSNHTISRFDDKGIDARVVEEAAGDIVRDPNFVPGTRFCFACNGVRFEARTYVLPSGSINVGTIFVVE